MQILGLTGSIGMGKSTIAAMFRERGIAVFDADAEVHRLYAGEAVSRIEAAFPGTTADGRVDRARLAAVLANNAERFRILEKIVHPLVRKGSRISSGPRLPGATRWPYWKSPCSSKRSWMHRWMRSSWFRRPGIFSEPAFSNAPA